MVAFSLGVEAKRYVTQVDFVQKLVDDTHKAYQDSEGCPDVRMAHEYGSRAEGVHTKGRERLDDIFRMLAFVNEHCFTLSERQMAIITENYMPASLMQIFGDDLVSEIGYLLQKFKLDELFEEVIVMMRRRGGKTVATAAFIAIILSSQPDANSNIYGKSKRVSVMMKDLVSDIVIKLIASNQFGIQRIKDNNEETLSVVTKYGTLNVGKFYPCNEDVLPPSLSFLLVFVVFLVKCGMAPLFPWSFSEKFYSSPPSTLP